MFKDIIHNVFQDVDQNACGVRLTVASNAQDCWFGRGGAAHASAPRARGRPGRTMTTSWAAFATRPILITRYLINNH